jgi:hypothetical protein
VIFWHLGLAAAIVYVTLGRSRIDYRFILIGAIAPDVVDGILGLFLFDGRAGRWAAHSLLAPVAVAVVVLLATRGETRLSLFGLSVGWLTHLVADGMWQAPLTFLWPMFGTKFSATPREPYSWDLFTHPLDHWTTWGAELVGLAILWWFWVAFDLKDRVRRDRFLRDGHLRA